MRIAARTALALFALDQASKALVVHALDLKTRGEFDVLPPFLVFRMAWNEGINFGLFASSHDLMRWGLVALAAVISLWVWLWVRRDHDGLPIQLSAGLLIGGAAGNALDRILYGAVADFLNTSLPGWENPYSFNVADISIFVGALGLVLLTGRAAETHAGPRKGPRRDKTP
ncbi:MAG: signal peptidase II [Paracoccaceae bacterium]